MCVCVCVCVCARVRVLTPVRLYLSRDREEEGGRGALVDLGEGYLKADYTTSHDFPLEENKVSVNKKPRNSKTEKVVVGGPPEAATHTARR